ncbi:MAG: hypothetical protein MK078_06465 [Crocinitomicaceae bacterium]|nr:hypothetical protein [Crocinitomicaceae bacterium]MCH2233881.1 hypothetical protein [Crocinitomicaceae bacterium]
MKINILFIPLLVILSMTSCSSDEGNKGQSDEATEEIEFAEEAEAEIEMEDYNHSSYLDAIEEAAFENDVVFPDSLDLSSLYEGLDPGPVFNGIYGFTEDFFLTGFSTGTDIEKSYFVTWDFDEGLLNFINYGYNSYGEEVYFEMFNNNFLVVKSISYEGFENTIRV